MRKLITILSLLLSFSLFSADSFNDYKVVGYYTNWSLYRSPSFKPKDINFDLVTHINYAFAKVNKDGNIQLFDSWADVEHRTDWNTEKPYWGNFKELSDLKKKHPHLKTLISVGGWTLSDTFSALAENPVARANFARSAVKFCKQYDFNGIDIDWEYPGFAEHSGRPQDKENFTLLLATIHQAAKAANPPLLITIAAPAGPWHYKNMDVATIHQYLDWINLMTYDLHGPWDDADNQVTNHQSALFPTTVGTQELCIQSAVEYYMEQGVPSKKLVLGMPLYGRVFADSDGLHTPYKGPGKGTTQEAGVRFFSDIKKNLLDIYQLSWDEASLVPYLYNPDNKEFITFDNEESLRRKSQYIKEMQLGGAMVWELGLDTPATWEAMHAIVDELKAKS